ncbi:MAG: hypothetical protein NNA30_11885 [Nitrospira sp.]|nr:hypothetical protein [Nitrospira sp.]
MTRDFLPTADVIALLSLIVALSAYVATIRLRLIDRIKNAQDEEKKKLKTTSRLLTLADAPLVVSGLLLFFYAFWNNTLGLWFFCAESPNWMLSWSIGLLTFALVVLVAHHMGAWWKSIQA